VRVLTGQTAGLEGQRCATGLVRVFPHTTDCPQPPARPGIQIGPKIVRLNAAVSLSGESGYRGPAVRWLLTLSICAARLSTVCWNAYVRPAGRPLSGYD